MPYKQMASLYDDLMVDAPYDQWLSFIKHIFETVDITIENIADLGCGTGEITMKVAKEGYHVLGIDSSVDMLTRAEQKSTGKNLPIQWIHQDLRNLTGMKNLDAAVSFCDVINYIVSEEELRIAFENIANSLRSGGLFIFDVHSMNYVENHLINQTFTEVTDDISYIWDCFQGEHKGEMYHEITFFALDHDEKYDRFDECHHQRTYPIDFYKRLLQDAGFINLRLYHDFSFKIEKQPKNSERMFFVVEKG